MRKSSFSSQVLFCRDNRGHGPVADVDRNAKQPWPDQTGCFRCYLAACSTVLVSEEKGERGWDECLEQLQGGEKDATFSKEK